MKNQITIKGVTIAARPGTARKIEFRIPSNMSGQSFAAFRAENRAEIETFRASIESEAVESSEGDTSGRI